MHNIIHNYQFILNIEDTLSCAFCIPVGINTPNSDRLFSQNVLQPSHVITYLPINNLSILLSSLNIPMPQHL